MELIFIVLLILLNGTLAMSEIAIVSARHARLQERIDRDERGAKEALELAQEPNRFLATVQIGITMVGIMVGAIGGASVGKQIGVLIADVVPPLASYSEGIGVGLIVILTTYLSLVLGELVPKRLGIKYSERISVLIAPTMQSLAWLFSPFVWFLSFSTDFVLKLLGITPDKDDSISESEIIHMMQQGTTDGTFDTDEVEMIRGVFALDDKRVQSIMTPRPDVVLFDIHDSIENIKEQILNTPHSTYPISDHRTDQVIGVIKAKDLLAPLVRGEALDLKSLMRKPLFIPGVTDASSALDIFKSSAMEMAIVIDEHGGLDGIITANDIIEEIVGDIDSADPQAVQRDDGSWLVDGAMPLTRLDSIFDGFVIPEEENGNYNTLAGFVMVRLGRMPRIADVFHYEGWRYEVVDMDGSRVDRILISKS